jgi:formylglycine-generating enzyme required for sulfatase activity
MYCSTSTSPAQRGKSKQEENEMAVERMGLVKLYTPRDAGKVIDNMLRQRGVQGNPFSQSAIAALTRDNQIAASFGGVSAAQVQPAVQVVPASKAASIGIELVVIPGGECTIQETMGVNVPGFLLGKTPVTNGQYQVFIKETGHKEPTDWHNERFGIEAGADLPVVGVDHEDAKAFVAWAGLRLPNELEWERAARGADGLAYPWGNRFDANKAVFNTDRTKPVNREGVNQGASPEGVLDLAGNVWEWMGNYYGAIDLSDPKSPKLPESGQNVTVRGGSWFNDHPGYLRGGYRSSHYPGRRSSYLGFRVAGDL